MNKQTELDDLNDTIKWFKTVKRNNDMACILPDQSMMKNIIKWLEELKEYESWKNEEEWISVKEKMPEERNSIFAKLKGTDEWTPGMFEKISKNVLVTIAYDDGMCMVRQAHTMDGKWKTELSVSGGTVIAWKPLPEPYKETNHE